MAKQPIRMTQEFLEANTKAGQMTEADADGEWQKPSNMSADAEEEFLKILQRLSRPISLDQAG